MLCKCLIEHHKITVIKIALNHWCDCVIVIFYTPLAAEHREKPDPDSGLEIEISYILKCRKSSITLGIGMLISG